MQNQSGSGGIAVGGAPSWCLDPEHCVHLTAKGKKCGKCKNIPHLPDPESNFIEGSRSVWVHYPQGILRRSLAESDLYTSRGADARLFLGHVCEGVKPALENQEAALDSTVRLAPYPGHSLFQDSFFFCKFKKFGDAPALGDIYLEAVVDGYSGLAFAKIYPAQNAMNAADIWTTRVAPFFNRHGVPIEQVLTRKTHEYCGIAPVHPFETFLATSRIHHSEMNRFDQERESLCKQRCTLLQREFLGQALRSRYRHTLETLQHDLDSFVDLYNSAWPSLAPGLHGHPALWAYLDPGHVREIH